VRQWLGDALESAELLTLHITYEQFQLDAWLKGAVERRLEIIGEALRRSRDADPELFTSTPRLHEWIALRNFISHQYDGINEFAIWNAATGEVNELVLTLRSVLSPPQDD
jgi:uncharacterized protein with HEPN domain